ncbi:MAG: ferrochelatase [Rickettsiales bacterium]|nr:MAG: ferrochelatase [Rickettsiales bacterium]
MSKILNNKKLAIILFNLGGPDSLQAVKPFLFNLFNDKFIINLPKFFRYLLAYLISSTREKKAKGIYARMGGRSSIMPETQSQANALAEYLKDKLDCEFKIFICMRHWHPMSDEVVKQVCDYSADEIIYLPLYPQFSTTTTASSIDDFTSKISKSKLKNIVCKTVCCYPLEESFIKSQATLISSKLKKEKNYRILFSAHGLPKKTIDAGDPYQWQIEASVQAIINEIGIENLDYKITYQSKVGPLEWLKPNTEDEIEIAAKQGINLIIVPIAFVSEHSETKVELDMDYKEIAMKYSIDYVRIPTVSIDSLFIKSLGDIVINANKKPGSFTLSSKMSRICPGNFSKCPCNKS